MFKSPSHGIRPRQFLPSPPRAPGEVDDVEEEHGGPGVLLRLRQHAARHCRRHVGSVQRLRYDLSQSLQVLAAAAAAAAIPIHAAAAAAAGIAVAAAVSLAADAGREGVFYGGGGARSGGGGR
jgi:hypothetical protein